MKFFEQYADVTLKQWLLFSMAILLTIVASLLFAEWVLYDPLDKFEGTWRHSNDAQMRDQFTQLNILDGGDFSLTCGIKEGAMDLGIKPWSQSGDWDVEGDTLTFTDVTGGLRIPEAQVLRPYQLFLPNGTSQWKVHANSNELKLMSGDGVKIVFLRVESG